MGGSASSSAAIARAAEQVRHDQMQKTEEEIIAFVMPVYYTKSELAAEEREAASSAWKLIVNNKSQHFLEIRNQRQNDPNFPHVTCLEYFYDIFYNRLFDVHPSCKSLFKKSINKQGSFFARMISLLLGDIDDQEKWTKNLENMAHIHNKMGVKAVEYGISGEVLLYSIHMCVGDKIYTPLVHRGWAKIYSRMLDIIIPVVVHFELLNKEFAQQIAEKRLNSEGVKGSLFVETTKHSTATIAAIELRSAHSTASGGESSRSETLTR